MNKDETYLAFVKQYGVINENEELKFYFNFLTLVDLGFIAGEVADQTDANAWLKTLKQYEQAQNTFRGLCAQLDTVARTAPETSDNVNFADNLRQLCKKIEAYDGALFTTLKFNNPNLITFYRNKVVHKFLYFTPQMTLADWSALNTDLAQLVNLAAMNLEKRTVGPETINTAFVLSDPLTFQQVAKYNLWYQDALANNTISLKTIADFDTYFTYQNAVAGRVGSRRLNNVLKHPTKETFTNFYSHVKAVLKEYSFIAAFLDVYQITDRTGVFAFYRKWNQAETRFDKHEFFREFLPEYLNLLAEKTWTYLFKLNFQTYAVIDRAVLCQILYYLMVHIDDEEAVAALCKAAKNPDSLQVLGLTGRAGKDTNAELVTRYYRYPPFCENRFTQAVLIKFIRVYNSLNEHEKYLYASFVHFTKTFLAPKDPNTALIWVRHFLHYPEHAQLVPTIFPLILKYCTKPHDAENYTFEELEEDLVNQRNIKKSLLKEKTVL